MATALVSPVNILITQKNTEVNHISLKYVIPRNKLVYFLKEKNIKHDYEISPTFRLKLKEYKELIKENFIVEKSTQTKAVLKFNILNKNCNKTNAYDT